MVAAVFHNNYKGLVAAATIATIATIDFHIPIKSRAVTPPVITIFSMYVRIYGGNGGNGGSALILKGNLMCHHRGSMVARWWQRIDNWQGRARAYGASYPATG